MNERSKVVWGASFKKLFFCFALSVLVFGFGCAKPPTKEIANAKLAINAAKQAEAELYAPMDFKSAEDYLDQARDMLSSKKYKDARELAVASKNKAVKAKNEAIQAKIQAKTEAEQEISGLRTAIKSAEAAGAGKHNLAGLTAVKAVLGSAEGDYNMEKYQSAMEKARNGLSSAYSLEASSKEAESAAQAAASRIREEEEARRESLRRERDEAQRRRREEEKARFKPRKPPKTRRHIVQRGDCLWTISRDVDIYGDPYQWPIIYKENRSQINDPDLIYPGQNFTIPRDKSDWETRTAVRFAKHRGPWSLFDGK